MEQAFENLKKEGKNDVDSLVKWMKDSDIIESTKEWETKARLLFKDCEDMNNIQVEKFKEALEKLAKERRKSVEDLTKMLVAQEPLLLDAIKAFKDATKK